MSIENESAPKGFAVVGQLDNRVSKKLENNSNSVTMGNGMPTRREGKVGDITVRRMPSLGNRMYVKTHSGWLDVNQMTQSGNLIWQKVHYTSNKWQDFDTASEVRFARDEHGYVNVRGKAKIVSGTADTDAIFTFPEGYRPHNDMAFLVAAGTNQDYYGHLKVSTAGVVQLVDASGDTETALKAALYLDCIRFFSKPAVSATQSTIGGSGGNPGGGVGSSGGAGGGSPR